MADMTQVLTMTQSQGVELPNVLRWYKVDLNFSETANASMRAVATHNILTIPAGYAFAKAYGHVKVAIASTSSGTTIQLGIGGVGLTAAIPEASYLDQVGAGFETQLNDLEDATCCIYPYAATANDTLDLIVGTEAILTGRIILNVALIKID